MKQLFSIIYIAYLSIFFCSSCVGTKKFKALEEEKQKLENTLLGTKQELSEAKRTLNKLQDASFSSNKIQIEAIQNLKQVQEEQQLALDAAQSATVSCQGQLQQIQKKLVGEDSLKNKKLDTYKKIQTELSQQNKSLHKIKADINLIISENPTMNLTQSLNKDELILSFDNNHLFSSTSRSISTLGRELLYELAEVLKKYPSIYIDINGHMPASTEIKENWKNSTRKTLSVLYTLIQKDLIQDRMRVIAYGQFKPIADAKDPLASQKNSRTEIILHYKNIELLKLIPINK